METKPGETLITERMIINIGPSHPITHGTLRIQCELDGETITRTGLEIGYLHRGYEKQCENVFYQYVVPYAERLNYMGPCHNSNAWCYAVEELLEIESPPRANALRVITSELSRIIDHCVCIATNLVDLGALTNFWYLYGYREKIYTLFEELTGARMMVNYPRIGGVSMDVPDGWLDRCRKILGEMDEVLADVIGLVKNNGIFQDRTRGVGVMDPKLALNHGWTGPCIRACGIGYDVRKARPYWGYEKYDWTVPVYHGCDTYDRIMVRFDEIEQSRSLVLQAMDSLPEGPFLVEDHAIAMPAKGKVYNQMEALINHFKVVMHGIRPPRAEIYSATEGGNGELGFYIVSDGSPQAWRVRIRPPCFANYTAFPQLINGSLLSDVAAILGSVNVIAGELDR
jgi:NADH:ubiquinone oxidoreductase subunit D